MMDEPQFIIFGTAHIATLFITLSVAYLIPLYLKKLNFHTKLKLGTVLAVVLIVNEIIRIFISTLIYDNPLGLSLPLHLCGMSALLSAWMLYQHNYRVYEVAYFWGVGGSISAMLTPDLLLGFPHPSFIHFFIGHGLILLGVLYATLVFEFRPTLGSVARAVSAALLMMLLIAPINLLLDTNYMYLCEKPLQTTLLEFMGPWPWYIISLVVIGTLVMLLCYLPFVIIRKLN